MTPRDIEKDKTSRHAGKTMLNLLIYLGTAEIPLQMLAVFKAAILHKLDFPQLHWTHQVVEGLVPSCSMWWLSPAVWKPWRPLVFSLSIPKPTFAPNCRAQKLVFGMPQMEQIVVQEKAQPGWNRPCKEQITWVWLIGPKFDSELNHLMWSQCPKPSSKPPWWFWWLVSSIPSHGRIAVGKLPAAWQTIFKFFERRRCADLEAKAEKKPPQHQKCLAYTIHESNEIGSWHTPSLKLAYVSLLHIIQIWYI